MTLNKTRVRAIVRKELREFAFGVIHATLGLALGLAAALLLANRLGWRIVSATLDRERLVTARV